MIIEFDDKPRRPIAGDKILLIDSEGNGTVMTVPTTSPDWRIEWIIKRILGYATIEEMETRHKQERGRDQYQLERLQKEVDEFRAAKAEAQRRFFSGEKASTTGIPDATREELKRLKAENKRLTNENYNLRSKLNVTDNEDAELVTETEKPEAEEDPSSGYEPYEWMKAP